MASNIPKWLRNRRTVAIVIVSVFLIITALSGVFVVDQTEEGVVLRFGRYIRTVPPGLHFKIPLGVEKHVNVPTQIIQNMSFGFRTERPGVTTIFSAVDYPEESIMLTGDLNIVDVEWIIQYRISEPTKWLFNVDNRLQTMRDISQAIVNQLVGDRGIIDILGNERTNIEDHAESAINESLKSYQLGITVTAVRLQNIVPPVGRVQDAFEDVNKAVQDMNRLINEGREAFNKEIPRARGEALQIIEIARGYAAERVNEAEGNAARFTSVYQEYVQDPDTMIPRLYYEMVEDVLSQGGRTRILDQNIDTAIPFLNLLPQGGDITGASQ